MKGLILKDLYVMKSMGRSYLLMFCVFAFLTLMGIYDGISFVSFLMVMMLVMMPINTFAYDEQAKFDRFAAATPAGRKGVVAAKYLFTAMLLGVCLAICILLQVGLYVFGNSGDTLGEMLAVAAASVSMGGILNAILLPLIFKFGTQKSRVFLMISVGLIVASAVILLGVIADRGTDMVGLIGTAAGLVPLLCAGLLVISYFISLGIYGKKEL